MAGWLLLAGLGGDWLCRDMPALTACPCCCSQQPQFCCWSRLHLLNCCHLLCTSKATRTIGVGRLYTHMKGGGGACAWVCQAGVCFSARAAALLSLSGASAQCHNTVGACPVLYIHRSTATTLLYHHCYYACFLFFPGAGPCNRSGPCSHQGLLCTAQISPLMYAFIVCVCLLRMYTHSVCALCVLSACVLHCACAAFTVNIRLRCRLDVLLSTRIASGGCSRLRACVRWGVDMGLHGCRPCAGADSSWLCGRNCQGPQLDT